MKVRVHFTVNGTEKHVDYTSKNKVVLTDDVRENLIEQFRFDYGNYAVDGVELVE